MPIRISAEGSIPASSNSEQYTYPADRTGRSQPVVTRKCSAKCAAARRSTRYLGATRAQMDGAARRSTTVPATPPPTCTRLLAVHESVRRAQSRPPRQPLGTSATRMSAVPTPVARLPPPWHACTLRKTKDPTFVATNPLCEALDPTSEATDRVRGASLLTSGAWLPTLEAPSRKLKQIAGDFEFAVTVKRFADSRTRHLEPETKIQ